MSEVTAGKVPILESIGVAYKYLAANWQRWIPACILLGGVSAWYQMQSVRTTLDASNGVNSGFTLFGVFCVFMLTSIVVGVGIYRHVIRGEFNPPIGIGFGIDEMRVLGVTLSLLLIFGIIGGFLLILFALAASILVASSGLNPELASTNPDLFVTQFAAAMGSGNGPLLLLFGMALMCGLIFVSVRLAFVTVATVSEQRMMVFQTWSFAKGNFWRIVASMLLAVLPLVIVGGIIVGVTNLLILGGAAKDKLPEASLAQLFAIGFIEGFINAIISIVSIALIAYLYKGLRPSDEELEALNKKASDS